MDVVSRQWRTVRVSRKRLDCNASSWTQLRMTRHSGARSTHRNGTSEINAELNRLLVSHEHSTKVVRATLETRICLLLIRLVARTICLHCDNRWEENVNRKWTESCKQVCTKYYIDSHRYRVECRQPVEDCASEQEKTRLQCFSVDTIT